MALLVVVAAFGTGAAGTTALLWDQESAALGFTADVPPPDPVATVAEPLAQSNASHPAGDLDRLPATPLGTGNETGEILTQSLNGTNGTAGHPVENETDVVPGNETRGTETAKPGQPDVIHPPAPAQNDSVIAEGDANASVPVADSEESSPEVVDEPAAEDTQVAPDTAPTEPTVEAGADTAEADAVPSGEDRATTKSGSGPADAVEAESEGGEEPAQPPTEQSPASTVDPVEDQDPTETGPVSETQELDGELTSTDADATDPDPGEATDETEPLESDSTTTSTEPTAEPETVETGSTDPTTPDADTEPSG